MGKSDSAPTIGHNSQMDPAVKKALGDIIDKIERLEDEARGIAADKKDAYAMAKSQGFDTKILRKVIQRRRIEKAEREEMDQLIDLYEMTVEDLIGPV